MPEPLKFLELSQMPKPNQITMQIVQLHLSNNFNSEMNVITVKQDKDFLVIACFATVRTDKIGREFIAAHIYPLNMFQRLHLAEKYEKKILRTIRKRGNWDFFPQGLIDDIALAKDVNYMPPLKDLTGH